jgi:hypothetical protein
VGDADGAHARRGHRPVRAQRRHRRTIKKVVLELGGRSANIVCEDADLDKVVQDVLFGMTVHAGQACSLLTRTLVHSSRHDELVEKIIAALRFVKVGDPAESGSSSARSVSSSRSTMTTTRYGSPTTAATVWPPRCGPRIRPASEAAAGRRGRGQRWRRVSTGSPSICRPGPSAGGVSGG